MIEGTNDAEEQAERLVPIALRLHAHVNLIPLNPTPGWPTRPSSRHRIRGFASLLEDAGVTVTVRDTRGREIDAACGQLHTEHEARERAAAR
jgi:23S rRNA (adenine2503-C2)-methyltransferase